MKTRFRIDAEQAGQQSPPHHRSVNTPLPWSPRSLVTSGTPPTKTPAEYFLRRGAACCARFSAADQSLRRGTACCARCCAADQCRSLATTRSIPASRLGSGFNRNSRSHVCLLRPKKRANLRTVPTFLPGSGRKVEVAENKPLNPLYPVLELHDAPQANCRVPSASH
jgi:hypothetical protein